MSKVCYYQHVLKKNYENFHWGKQQSCGYRSKNTTILQMASAYWIPVYAVGRTLGESFGNNGNAVDLFAGSQKYFTN